MSISVSNSSAAAYLQMMQSSAAQSDSVQDQSAMSFQDMLAANGLWSNMPVFSSISSVNSTTDLTALMTEKKTAFLEELQMKATTVGSMTDSTTLPDSLQTAFGTNSSLLPGFNEEENMKEEIASPVKQVAQDSESVNTKQLTLTGTVPPSVISQTSQVSEDFTVAQMKQVLLNLISSLNTEDNSGTSIITDSISSDMSDQLENFDLEAESDDQIVSLFKSILQELKAEQSNASSSVSDDSETSSGSFPNSIQLTGSYLPPFNWKPKISTNNATTSNTSISTTFY